MLRRLLIANRGEIALRIMRTAHRLGIECCAVYADPDAAAPFVQAADLALPLRGDSAADTYLNIDKLLDAARRGGVDAVHPGYGFLSENATFASAVTDAGLRFVGPTAVTIAQMGSKETAKQAAAALGIPVVPGSEGARTEPEALRALADTIGYPLLIKAALGGGGRGLRRVDEPSQFDAALASAQREAEAAFGDRAMLLERFLDGCRHVEVQILADHHGQVRHLHDRDCSLQRRHQKIIEEAPAFGLPATLREALAADAVRLAEAIGYRGAGTVEYAVLGDSYYFLEMNTRLQVEHPVTEAVTGLDLVEWQLRIAADEALTFTQQSIEVRGHALEARVYAEDPAAGFLPAAGVLEHVQWPDSVRVDAGVVTGSRVSEFFDPMIAKVISSAASRRAALRDLDRALGQVRIAGIPTNTDYLRTLLALPEFIAGTHSTGTLGRREAERQAVSGTDQTRTRVVTRTCVEALAAAVLSYSAAPAGSVATAVGSAWDRSDGFRLNQPARSRRRFRCADSLFTVEHSGGDLFIDDAQHALQVQGARRLAGSGHSRLDFQLDSIAVRAEVRCASSGCTVWLRDGTWLLLPVPVALPDALGASGGLEVRAPMAGKVVALHVNAGDAVEAGMTLLVLEAMKMEHPLLAPSAGRIGELRVGVGDSVAAESLLIALEAAAGKAETGDSRTVAALAADAVTGEADESAS